MSSPSSQSENAAPPAPLSQDLPLSTVAAVPDRFAASAELSDQNGGLDSHLVLDQPPSSTPPNRSIDTDQDIAKDPAIRARASNQGNQRQPGPSLLSQALASARGIQPQKPIHIHSHNNIHSTNYDLNNSNNSNSSSNSNGTRNSTTRPPEGQSNATSHIRLDRARESSDSSPYTLSPSTHVKNGEHHQTSLDCHLAQSTSTMESPFMFPIASPALKGRDANALQHHYNPSNLAQAREMLIDHRHFLDRATGRACTSLDLDRSTVDLFMPRALPLSASPPEDSTITTKPSPILGDSAAFLSDKLSKNDALQATASVPAQRSCMPQDMIPSPEKTGKIWSIGSGHVEEEDGLVEKSVAEAMAGVEPNARSRKASYSLRFFKEGLPPEEKHRRKDIKPMPRDKLPATFEEGSTRDAFNDAQISLSDADHIVLQGTRDGDPTSPAMKYFNVRSPNTVTDGDTTPPALQTKRRQDSRAALAEPILPSAQVGPLPVSRADCLEMRSESANGHNGSQSNDDIANNQFTEPRDFLDDHHPGNDEIVSPLRDGAEAEADVDVDVDAGTGEADADCEDADESGEEKISSAVFLPHKEMPDARNSSTDPAGSSQVHRSRSISHSSSHPWLVKADEPEPEPRIDTPDQDVNFIAPSDQPCPQSFEIVASHEPDVLQDAPDDVFNNASDDIELNKCPRVKKSSTLVTPYEDHVHQHQYMSRQPLDAIELIPYKHQVGGHTTLWRFSRRAVCKQLNNRENEFYETIERYHRDLLPFLPRYIGVLNVTFQKQPRRKSMLKRDEVSAGERRKVLENNQGLENTVNGVDHASPDCPTSDVSAPTSNRVVSQSLANAALRIPTVTFDDNKHILPRNLLQPTPPSKFYRRRSTSASKFYDHGSSPQSPRPHLDERPNSWGATTINKRLRNEVFNDAFLKAPVEVQKHRRPHQRAVPRPTLQRLLRPASSDPNLAFFDKQEERRNVEVMAEAATSPLSSTAPSHVQKHGQTQSDVGVYPLLGSAKPDEATAATSVKDVSGTSAPEPETLKASLNSVRRKRRYSAGGLRRRPRDVRDSRGVLKYFEEADDAEYKNGNDSSESRGKHAEDENISAPGHLEAAAAKAETEVTDDVHKASIRPSDMTQSTATTASPSVLPGEMTEFQKIPRPINPKEAKTQGDRVEYFLLMEDLTAGMKRPCMMDLKMGTRQYGVDATLKKQKSQQEKCRTTTSAELGVRICGLQVWNVQTQSYEFQDKYFGREVKAGIQFQDALQKFLYNGVDLGSILRHIPVILKKLAQLEQIVRGLRGYRFYAASLLMFYDGDDTEETGYETMYDSTTDAATDTEETTRRRRRNPREIDFKMADFANSVTPFDDISNKACPPRHPNEPDSGFLKGLKSLRHYFLQIQRDVRSELNLGSRSVRGIHHPWTAVHMGGGGGGDVQNDVEEDVESGSSVSL
ncbi:hypothetical protein E4U54_003555 [Claviceps lovelessii]|nr:hypothetical protein E4U54_003555 [Claviceps lovelessii]